MLAGSGSRLDRLLRRSAWYFHRARAMPPREVPHRVHEQLERALARREGVVARRVGTDLSRHDTGLGAQVLQWSSRPGVQEFRASVSAGLTRGEVLVFGIPSRTEDDGSIAWDLDPVTGYRWPSDFCFDVPLVPRSDQPVEVKYVWELNRLLFLLAAAAHARATADDIAAATCRRHLRSWLELHPPRRGVSWRSGIELAHRIIVLVVVLELVGAGDDSLEGLVAQGVAEHVDWIRRFPSRFSSANNHRVTELVALLVAGTAYPDSVTGSELDRWWSELETVAVQQFHEDGVPVEQALTYGYQVVEWICVALSCARRTSRRPTAQLVERLLDAASFLATVTDSSGQPVRINDDDDSRLLTASVPFGAMAPVIQSWLAAEVDSEPVEPRTGLTTFVAGGYTTWRGGTGVGDEVLLVFDHGPLGMGHLAAHAHADTLAVYLHLGGKPVLVDAGTYLYHSGGAWRDRLRGTAEHNTVAVGGENSSLIAGPFSWRRDHRADGRLVSANVSPARWAVEAEHAGYVSRFDVLHRRTVAGNGRDEIHLSDSLEGDFGGVIIRWSVLLAPGLTATSTPSGWLVRDGLADVVGIDVDAWPDARRLEEPAWVSPSFGTLERSTRLVVEGSAPRATGIDVMLHLL